MSNTLLNKNQVGDGIWTSDNLLAGTNISITQVQQPVIDSNTLALWHMNNTVEDIINNQSTTFSGSYVDGKFDKAAYFSSGTAITQSENGKVLATSSYTVDFWLKVNSFGSYGVTLNFVAPGQGGMTFKSNSVLLDGYLLSSGTTINYDFSSLTSSFAHIAFVKDFTNSKTYFFFNGTKIWEGAFFSHSGFYLGFAYAGSNAYLDEVRVSNVARWTSDFTPFTVPYAASAGPAQYAINNTKADPDLSSYLQNTATGTDSLTIKGIATSAPKNTNIGESSIIPGNTGYGVAVGYGATGSTGSVVIGSQAQATDANSVAIGRNAVTNSQSVAIGGTANYSTATTASGAYSIAVGYNAKATATNAIQLSTGTNSTASTLQFLNTTVIDANGKVPLTTLPIVQCTQAEYDALVQAGTVDSNTLYIITLAS